MRALLGGAVGAAAAAAAWLAVEHYTQANLGWLVCFVGLVTGLSVSCAGGASARGSFINGAIAIALTLAAIAGGQQVYAKIMQANSSAASAKVVDDTKNAADADGEADDTDAEDSKPALDLHELDTEEPGLGKSGYSKSAMKKSFGEWDMIWMCVAALAAYVTGKGGGKAGCAVATEAVPEQQPDDAAENDGE